MIVFPPEFVKTRFPGYFFNVDTKVLYSIKGTGELRPLKKHSGFRGYHRFLHRYVDVLPGYVISVNGCKRRVTDKYLDSLIRTTNELQIVDVV